MESFVTYLLAAMVAWVSPSMQKQHEPPEDAQARYEAIARDVAAVVLDEDETPIFSGPGGRARTGLLLLSVASYESYFRKDVDDGTRLGDHGRSFCLMQIHVGDGVTREGWSGPELVADRKRCVRAALHILLGSFGACRRLPLDDRLSAYATGRCEEGSDASRARVGRARKWWEAHGAPKEPQAAPASTP
jgi:hypothetical protein